MSPCWSSAAFARLQGEAHGTARPQTPRRHTRWCINTSARLHFLFLSFPEVAWTHIPVEFKARAPRSSYDCASLEYQRQRLAADECLFDPEKEQITRSYEEHLQCRDVCVWRSLCLSAAHTLFHLPPFDAAHVLISSKSEAWEDNVGWMMGAR